MPTHRFTGLSLAFAAVLAVCPVPRLLVAQDAASDNWMATRPVLIRRAAQLDSLAASTAYTSRSRTRAAEEAELIRRRLVAGDFRVGDRVYVEIESAPAGFGAVGIPSLQQDTLTVLDGARIVIRGVGEIALGGVLRAELNTRLNDAVAEVLLNARVTARPLVRLAVFGAVGRSGYFTLPLETRLDGLLMIAGGPTAEADPAGIRLVRGDTVLFSEAEVLTAIADGTVIGAMGLREGDQLMVEQRIQVLDRQGTQQLLTQLLLQSVFFVFWGRRW